jgi:hypothetical protein
MTDAIITAFTTSQAVRCQARLMAMLMQNLLDIQNGRPQVTFSPESFEEAPKEFGFGAENLSEFAKEYYRRVS